jgi:hypothetical protein
MSKTREEREAIALAVLTAPVEIASAALAKQVGLTREMTRQIRLGLRYANVLPHLERLEPDAMVRTCQDCSLFHHQPGRQQSDNGSGSRTYGRCSIGIPEAAESLHYARGCGAFQR